MAGKARKHGKVNKGGVPKKATKNEARKRRIKFVDPVSNISKEQKASLEAQAVQIEHDYTLEKMREKQMLMKEKAERRRRELERLENIELKKGMTKAQAQAIAGRRMNKPLHGIPQRGYAGKRHKKHHGTAGATKGRSDVEEEYEYEEEEEEEQESFDDKKSEQDYSDTANERACEYRKGGYHPVLIGEIYNNRYRIVKKLGWGYFSTVWLVWDYNEARYQAMKIQKSEQSYTEAAYDEIKLLSEVMHADPHKNRCCACLNDYFEHHGPHGMHVCMVFDVYGENLLCLMQEYDYRGIPLPLVKAITHQVLIALEHLASIDIIHTDLKPENVLLATPKHSIISLMRHYHPPPLNQRPRLVERDPKTMTKSQKRRYYKKLAKEKEGKEFTGEENDPFVSDVEKDYPHSSQTQHEVTLSHRNSSDRKSSTDTKKVKNEEATVTEDEYTEKQSPEEQEKESLACTTTEKDKFGASQSHKSSSREHNDANDKNAAMTHIEKDNLVKEDNHEEPHDRYDSETSKASEEWEVNRFQNVVVADFGNSCWTYKQFSAEVQTRQYRAPEVILGEPYGTAIDIWSCACMMFELITGEFLFDPQRGEDYTRDEDHLALMSELLGDLPESMRLGNGKCRSYFYNSRGELRNIKQLKYWDLEDLLISKHHFKPEKAKEIAEFLLPMLEFEPERRATANEMLREFESFFVVTKDDFEPHLVFSAKKEDEEEFGEDNKHDESMSEQQEEEEQESFYDDEDEDEYEYDEEEEEEEVNNANVNDNSSNNSNTYEEEKEGTYSDWEEDTDSDVNNRVRKEDNEMDADYEYHHHQHHHQHYHHTHQHPNTTNEHYSSMQLHQSHKYVDEPRRSEHSENDNSKQLDAEEKVEHNNYLLHNAKPEKSSPRYEQYNNAIHNSHGRTNSEDYAESIYYLHQTPPLHNHNHNHNHNNNNNASDNEDNEVVANNYNQRRREQKQQQHHYYREHQHQQPIYALQQEPHEEEEWEEQQEEEQEQQELLLSEENYQKWKEVSHDLDRNNALYYDAKQKNHESKDHSKFTTNITQGATQQYITKQSNNNNNDVKNYIYNRGSSFSTSAYSSASSSTFTSRSSATSMPSAKSFGHSVSTNERNMNVTSETVDDHTIPSQSEKRQINQIQKEHALHNQRNNYIDNNNNNNNKGKEDHVAAIITKEKESHEFAKIFHDKLHSDKINYKNEMEQYEEEESAAHPRHTFQNKYLREAYYRQEYAKLTNEQDKYVLTNKSTTGIADNTNTESNDLTHTLDNTEHSHTESNNYIKKEELQQHHYDPTVRSGAAAINNDNNINIDAYVHKNKTGDTECNNEDAEARRVREAREASYRYWEEHSILNKVSLAERGLTIDDIQTVLSGQRLATAAAEEAANEVIHILSAEVFPAATTLSTTTSSSRTFPPSMSATNTLTCNNYVDTHPKYETFYNSENDDGNDADCEDECEADDEDECEDEDKIKNIDYVNNDNNSNNNNNDNNNDDNENADKHNAAIKSVTDNSKNECDFVCKSAVYTEAMPVDMNNTHINEDRKSKSRSNSESDINTTNESKCSKKYLSQNENNLDNVQGESEITSVKSNINSCHIKNDIGSINDNVDEVNHRNSHESNTHVKCTYTTTTTSSIATEEEAATTLSAQLNNMTSLQSNVMEEVNTNESASQSVKYEIQQEKN